MLLHSAPSAGDNGTRGDDCGGGSCGLAVAQWLCGNFDMDG